MAVTGPVALEVAISETGSVDIATDGAVLTSAALSVASEQPAAATMAMTAAAAVVQRTADDRTAENCLFTAIFIERTFRCRPTDCVVAGSEKVSHRKYSNGGLQEEMQVSGVWCRSTERPTDHRAPGVARQGATRYSGTVLLQPYTSPSAGAADVLTTVDIEKWVSPDAGT
jgi:hypothetical protein